MTRAGNHRPLPALDSKAVLLCCGLLLVFEAWFLAAAWARGFSVFRPALGQNYDFACFWAAGRLALAGRAAAAYHWPALKEVLSAAIGAQFGGGTLPWFYPPLFFVIVTPLALLPYAAAAAVWAALALGVYLAAICAVVAGGVAAIAALAAPVVAINLWTGQNGLLTAGIFGAALALLDRRPILSGVLIGCLAYKPQWGVLFPLVLAVGGRWRSFAAAAATVVALVLVAGTVFGWDTFAAFIDASRKARNVFLQQQGTAPLGVLHWEHLESVYGLLRALGTGAAPAWAAHLAAALAAVAMSLLIVAGRASPSLQAASIVTAAFLVTPYSLVNDLAILTVALAFLVADGLASGFRRWEIAALAVAYALPLPYLIAPAVLAAADGGGSPRDLPGLGPLICAILAAIILRRWRAQVSPGSSKPAVSSTTYSGRRFTSS
jgi:Glycosyltransferase family 87